MECTAQAGRSAAWVVVSLKSISRAHRRSGSHMMTPGRIPLCITPRWCNSLTMVTSSMPIDNASPSSEPPVAISDVSGIPPVSSRIATQPCGNSMTRGCETISTDMLLTISHSRRNAASSARPRRVMARCLDEHGNSATRLTATVEPECFVAREFVDQLVAGNHDRCLEPLSPAAMPRAAYSIRLELVPEH